MIDTFIELKWLCRLLRDMSVFIPPCILLYGDDKSAISILINVVFH